MAALLTIPCVYNASKEVLDENEKDKFERFLGLRLLCKLAI